MNGYAYYEITVRGRLSDALAAAFPDLTATAHCGQTILRGELVDQSALYGVLGQIESLGLDLLGVRSTCPPEHPGRPQTNSAL